MADPRVILILGDDEYQVGLKAREVVDQLVPPAERDFALEVFDGRVDTVDAAAALIRQAIEAVQTRSFLGGSKTVWLREIEFLGASRTSEAVTLKPSIEALRDTVLDGVPEGHVLVLSGSGISASGMVPKAAATLVKRGLGQVIQFEARRNKRLVRSEALDLLRTGAAERGRTLSAEVCEHLVARCGSDSRLLMSELEKLLLYVGDQAPTVADIAEIVTASQDAEVWDLLDAFGERNAPLVLSTLRRLLDAGASEVFLAMQLVTRTNELLLLRDSMDRRFMTGSRSLQWQSNLPEPLPEAVEALDKRWNPASKHEFVQGKLGSQCRRFKRIELRRARHVLIQAYERLVSLTVPGDLLLELAVADALRVAPGV